MTKMHLIDMFELGMDRKVLPCKHNDAGLAINLGHGFKQMPPGVESVGLPEWDAECMPLPYTDRSAGTIFAFHFLEHIRNMDGVLHECQRVLMFDGVLNIVVPYGMGHMAIQDPTHVRFFNEDTWKTLFSNQYYETGPWRWRFVVNTNIIMGVKGQNLALVTQLIKVG
jgi:Methyltransferase domain